MNSFLALGGSLECHVGQAKLNDNSQFLADGSALNCHDWILSKVSEAKRMTTPSFGEHL